jgi:hypothetical protein
MSSARYRNAWIWIAIAALTVTTCARAQAGFHAASACTSPVFEFLAGQQNAATLAAAHNGRPVSSHAGKLTAHGVDLGAWQALFPVQFVGLVAPMSLLPARSFLPPDRTPSAPALPAKSQRPPPAAFL